MERIRENLATPETLGDRLNIPQTLGRPGRVLPGIRACFVLVSVLVLLAPATTYAAGSLTVSGAAPGTFSATLTGADQTAYTSLTSYTASDSTGTGNGWNITFQASQLTCAAGNGRCPTGGDKLALGSLVMAPPTVACNSSCNGRSSPPAIKISFNTAIDASTAVKVASAAQNTGENSYTFTPGNISGVSGHNLSLSVPGSAYASTYNSTLTVSIVSGP